MIGLPVRRSLPKFPKTTVEIGTPKMMLAWAQPCDSLGHTCETMGIPVADLDADDVDLLTEMNEQMHVILSSLTDGETFDVVMGSGRGRGYEAWRQLHGVSESDCGSFSPSQAAAHFIHENVPR